MEQKCEVCGSVIVVKDTDVKVCSSCIFGSLETEFAPERTGTASGLFVEVDEIHPLFPEFEDIEVIHSGGMGTVFKARQISLDRWVALKVMKPELAEDPEFQERFEREGKTMAKLNHPNIVSVYEFGKRGGFHFLVMEYVEGCDLHQLMKGNKLDSTSLLRLVPQICDALAFAHESDVIHRDVKPGNILIDRSGNVKMTDFGLAKVMQPSVDVSLTMEGVGMGTLHYMAPEQLADARSTDARSDIYALGVVIYEMLTGKLPTGNFPPPTSSLARRDKRLDKAVMRAMEQSPNDRFPSVKKFSEQIEPSVRASPETDKRGSSAKLFIAAAAVILLGCAGFFAFQSRNANEVDPLPADSDQNVGEKFTIQLQSGSLQSWTSGYEELNTTIAEGVNDFVRVGGSRIHKGNWWAFRENMIVVSTDEHRTGRPMQDMTDNYSLHNNGVLGVPGRQSPNFLPFSKKLIGTSLGVWQANRFAVVITKGGEPIVAADPLWSEQNPGILEKIHSIENAVSASVNVKVGVIVTGDGKTVSWHIDHGLLEGPPDSVKITQAAAGFGHVFGLTTEGKVIVWSHPELESFTYTTRALKIPAFHGRAIAIKASMFVGAVQLEDGRWLAWGHDFDQGLNRKINEIGKAIDIELFAPTASGAKLLWIKPEQERFFEKHPQNQIVNTKTMARLSLVTFSDYDRIEWTRDGKVIKGENKEELILNGVTPGDAGEYIGTVFLDNTPHQTSPAVIAVINSDRKVIQRKVGQPFSISIEVTGDVEAYNWMRNGIPIQRGDRIKGLTTPTLTIDSINMGDSGEYQCGLRRDGVFAKSKPTQLRVFK